MSGMIKRSGADVFETLDRIGAAMYGKKRFSMEDDGTVYDRAIDGWHESLDAAIDYFVEELENDFWFK